MVRKMKKTYKIDIDCASCAAKCEDAARKVDGVSDVNINFMTQKMKVEFDDDADVDVIMKNVTKACKKVESDFEIEL